tara:strand:+ start:223 stop:456 length:234 start_codon:yes stop_codon:yes gene_type:complete
MHSDTETIQALLDERGQLMMRAGSLCGRVMVLAEMLGETIRDLEHSPNDPAHPKNLRHIQERLEDALNEYNDAEKPF